MGSNTIITMMCLMLLGIFVLSINTMILNNSKSSFYNEYYLTAISLGQSVIDEAKTKAFDERTISKSYTSSDSMTAPGSLGKDGAELATSVNSKDALTNNCFGSQTSYDDVDDYNNYYRTVTTPRAENFTILCTVQYASVTCPDSLFPNSGNTKSFCKVMTVKVTSPYFVRDTAVTTNTLDTLYLRYAFTY